MGRNRIMHDHDLCHGHGHVKRHSSGFVRYKHNRRCDIGIIHNLPSAGTTLGAWNGRGDWDRDRDFSRQRRDTVAFLAAAAAEERGR